MKSLKVVLATGLIGFGLTACNEIEVVNGELENKYISSARQYVGTYKGKMESVAGELTLSLNGNRPVLTFKGANGSDILDRACNSEIGLMKSFKAEAHGSDYVITRATFAFDPKNCWSSVEGRELVLNFSEKSGKTRIAVELLRGTEWDRQCRVDPGNPAEGVPPRTVCENIPVTAYYKGRFKE